MRVLVTGGAGFIGSHIVDELLAAEHTVAVLDNLVTGSRENLPSGVDFYEVDIGQGEALKRVFDEVRPEVVCHQAAQMSVSRSVRDPLFDADVNVMGLLRVLDEAVRCGTRRVVFASSGGVLYGDVFEPAEETAPCDPVSPYGISKWVGERYLEFFARTHGLSGVALRYANVYGPRQNPHGEAGVVAIFSQHMLAAQPATIHGDGRYVRDYVYVEDVARANRLALKEELPQAFLALNIGTGCGTDVNELARQLHAECQRQLDDKEIPPPQHGEARPGDLRSSLVSSRRAQEILGWEPTVSLSQGLQKTVQWFAE